MEDLCQIPVPTQFIYFGTFRYIPFHHTTLTSSGLTLSVAEKTKNERFAIVIHMKHIHEIRLSTDGNNSGLVLLVSKFCSKRIRQILNIPEPGILDNIFTFDTNSAYDCNRLLLISINGSNKAFLTELKDKLTDIQQNTLEYRHFFSIIDSDEYIALLNDLESSKNSPPWKKKILSNVMRKTEYVRHVEIPLRVSQDARNQYYNGNGRMSASLMHISNQANKSKLNHEYQMRGNIREAIDSRGNVNFYNLNCIGRDAVTFNERLQDDGVVLRTRSINPTLYTFRGDVELPGTSMQLKPRIIEKRQIVQIEEDEASSSLSAKISRIDDDILFTYPPGEVGAISVHFHDVETLKPDGMLNDTIIDFYLKFIQKNSLPPERFSSIFIFNAFFYSRLTNITNESFTIGCLSSSINRANWISMNYKAVEKWTKNVNLFDKECVLIPINEDVHWYLAVIINPGFSIRKSDSFEKGKHEKKTKILILDSLISSYDIKRKCTVSILKDYLECEFNNKCKKAIESGAWFCKNNIEKVFLKDVPQQENFTDCGLFLLKYAECFLEKPPLLILRCDNFNSWYPLFKVDSRLKILSRIRALSSEIKWKAYEEFSQRKSAENEFQDDQQRCKNVSFLMGSRKSQPKNSLNRSLSSNDINTVEFENRRIRRISN